MRIVLAVVVLVLAGCTAPQGLTGTTPVPTEPPKEPIAPAQGEWRQYPLGVSGTRAQVGETALTHATIGGLRALWTVDVGGAVTGTPIVADGRVYFGSWDKHVYAVDADDGAPAWTFATQGQVDGTVAAVGDSVYVGDGKGYLYRLDARTGAERWRALLDDEPGAHLYSSPLVHDGVVYIGVASDQHSVRLYPEPQPLTARGSVVAVDAAEGALKWRWWVQRPDQDGLGGSVWGSPVLDTATMTLFIGTGNAYTDPAGNRTDAIAALDARTGQERWVFQATRSDVWTQRKPQNPDWDFGSSPVYWASEGKRLAIAAQKSGVVWARDAATGAAVWSQGTPRSGADVTASPAILDGTLFVGSQGDRSVRAIDLGTGKLRWEKELGAAVYSAAAAVPGLLFVGVSDGHLVVLDVGSGEELARVPTGQGGIFGGVSVAGGRVYTGTVPKGFLGNEGHLVAWGT